MTLTPSDRDVCAYSRWLPSVETNDVVQAIEIESKAIETNSAFTVVVVEHKRVGARRLAHGPLFELTQVGGTGHRRFCGPEA